MNNSLSDSVSIAAAVKIVFQDFESSRYSLLKRSNVKTAISTLASSCNPLKASAKFFFCSATLWVVNAVCFAVVAARSSPLAVINSASRSLTTSFAALNASSACTNSRSNPSIFCFCASLIFALFLMFSSIDCNLLLRSFSSY